jgi:hypothetical protein
MSAETQAAPTTIATGLCWAQTVSSADFDTTGKCSIISGDIDWL